MKHDPTFSLGTVVYPHSHLCKSLKYGQLGFQITVSYQAGTINSRVDRNEKDNKSEAYQGYLKKMVWKTTKDLEKILDPRSSVAKCSGIVPEKYPHYTIPTMFSLALEGLSPLPFLTRPHVYPMC
jgi:hypothetical protein